jgi:hypothetical protein
MLQKWAGEGAVIEVDVYTEMTRSAMYNVNSVSSTEPRSRTPNTISNGAPTTPSATT